MTEYLTSVKELLHPTDRDAKSSDDMASTVHDIHVVTSSACVWLNLSSRWFEDHLSPMYQTYALSGEVPAARHHHVNECRI